MGSRRDRIVAAGRFLGAASGIPGISVIGYAIKSPYPYQFIPHTGRELVRWSDAAKSLTGWQMLVWYRGTMDSPADALVTMRASTAAELLQAHWNAGEARRKGGE